MYSAVVPLSGQGSGAAWDNLPAAPASSLVAGVPDRAEKQSRCASQLVVATTMVFRTAAISLELLWAHSVTQPSRFQ